MVIPHVFPSIFSWTSPGWTVSFTWEVRFVKSFSSIFLNRSVSVPLYRMLFLWSTIMSSPGHAGPAEHAEVLVHRDLRLLRSLHLGGRWRGRKVDGVAGADLDAGRASRRALLGEELDLAVEELLHGDGLGRAVPAAPGAGAAEVVIDVDLALDLVALDRPLDGDALLGAGRSSHRPRPRPCRSHR